MKGGDAMLNLIYLKGGDFIKLIIELIKFALILVIACSLILTFVI